MQHKLLGFPEEGSFLHPKGFSKLIHSDECPISVKLKPGRISVGLSKLLQVQLEEEIFTKSSLAQKRSHTAPGSLVSPAKGRANLQLPVSPGSQAERMLQGKDDGN